MFIRVIKYAYMLLLDIALTIYICFKCLRNSSVQLSAKGSHAGTVILNFSCKGLRDRDILSKSDPQVILYTSVKDRANYTIVRVLSELILILGAVQVVLVYLETFSRAHFLFRSLLQLK